MRNEPKKPTIDANARKVKNNFENLLQSPISDEEWAMLADLENGPRTVEEYNAMVESLRRK